MKVRRVGNSRVMTIPEELDFAATEVLVQRVETGQLLVTPTDMVHASVVAQARESLHRNAATILKLPNRRHPRP